MRFIGSSLRVVCVALSVPKVESASPSVEWTRVPTIPRSEERRGARRDNGRMVRALCLLGLVFVGGPPRCDCGLAADGDPARRRRSLRSSAPGRRPLRRPEQVPTPLRGRPGGRGRPRSDHAHAAVPPAVRGLSQPPPTEASSPRRHSTGAASALRLRADAYVARDRRLRGTPERVPAASGQPPAEDSARSAPGAARRRGSSARYGSPSRAARDSSVLWRGRPALRLHDPRPVPGRCDCRTRAQPGGARSR
jgi:hypothetical protein